MTTEKEKDWNLSDEIRRIVPYAELDEIRWNSLIEQVEEKHKEFKRRLKEYVNLANDPLNEINPNKVLEEIDKLFGKHFQDNSKDFEVLYG